MKKTYRWLLTSGIVAAVATPFIAIAATNNAGYSFDFWAGSHRDLVTTTNSTNESNSIAYFFEGARSNLTKSVNANYSAQGRLFKKAYTEETSIFPDEENRYYDESMDSDNFGKLTSDAQLPKEYVTFELADQISLFSGDEVSGTWTDYDEKAFNAEDSDFYDSLKTATKVKIHVRDDLYWIDHNGNKTNYKITARDFLEGFRFNMYYFMGSWAAALDGAQYETDFANISSDLIKNWRIKWSPTRDLNNNYLLTMAGVDYHTFYGIDDNNQPYLDKDLLNDKSEFSPVGVDNPGTNEAAFNNYLTYEFTDPDALHDILVDKIFLSANFTYSPVSTEYIKDMNKNYDVKDNMPKESTLGQMGMIKYGLTYDKMLYSGRYYINEVSPFKVVAKQNTHYWDNTWVSDEHTIRSITQNYRVQDASLFPMLSYEQFKQGHEYQMPVNTIVSKLPVNDQKQIYDNSSFKFSLDANPLTTQNTYMWTSQPVITLDKEAASPFDSGYFNSDFALAMYGKAIEDFDIISSDEKQEVRGASVNTYWSTRGLAFKSQLQAFINWYAVKEQLGLNGDLWNIFTPATATYIDNGDSNKTKIAIDGIYTADESTYTITNPDDPNFISQKHDSNGLGFDYYEYSITEHPESPLIKKGTVTASEQIQSYQGAQGTLTAPNIPLRDLEEDQKNDPSVDPNDPVYQGDLVLIKEAMTNTLKEVLTEDRDYNLEFTLPIDTEIIRAEERKMYKDLTETLEKLSIPLENDHVAKISIKEIGKTPASSYNPEKKDISAARTSGYNTSTYMGWSSDVPYLLAWYVGPLATTSRASASLFQTLSLMLDESDTSSSAEREALNKNFPKTELLAKDFNAQTKKLTQQLIADIEKDIANPNSLGAKFFTTSDNANRQKVLDVLNSDYYLDIHKLSTDKIAEKDSVDMHFTSDLKEYMTNFLQSSFSGIYSVSASLALFATNDNSKWKTDDLLTLERELRNLSGGLFTFASAGFISPSRRIPTAVAYKPWLTTVTPQIESIYDFAAWRVDEEGK